MSDYKEAQHLSGKIQDLLASLDRKIDVEKLKELGLVVESLKVEGDNFSHAELKEIGKQQFLAYSALFHYIATFPNVPDPKSIGDVVINPSGVGIIENSNYRGYKPWFLERFQLIGYQRLAESVQFFDESWIKDSLKIDERHWKKIKAICDGAKLQFPERLLVNKNK